MLWPFQRCPQDIPAQSRRGKDAGRCGVQRRAGEDVKREGNSSASHSRSTLDSNPQTEGPPPADSRNNV